MVRSIGFVSSFSASREAPLGLQPLESIVAGGVHPADIARVLSDLMAPLAALHQRGGVHGAITTRNIGLDETGTLRLLAPRADANAENAERAPGFAAFEQYSDDPELPCGPWTDVYGLSAVAFTLVTGSPPPDALSRRVHDDYVSLASRALAEYDQSFLAAIDEGLSVLPEGRPRSMAAFAKRLGLSIDPVAPVPQARFTTKLQPMSQPARRPSSGSTWSGLVMPAVAVVAVVVLAVYFFWDSSAGSHEPVVDDVAVDEATTRPEPTTDESPKAEAASAPPVAPAAPTPAAEPASASSTTPPATSPTEPPASEQTAAANTVGGAPATTPAVPSTPFDILSNAANPSVAANAPAASAPEPAASATPPPAEAPVPEGNQPPAATPPTVPPPAVAPVIPPAPPPPAAAAVTPPAAVPVAPPPPRPPAPTPPPNPKAGTAKPTPPRPDVSPRSNPVAETQLSVPRGGPVDVRIDVRPWGEILVDNAYRGISPPLRALKLSPGRHTVEVRNANLPPYRVILDIKPGQSPVGIFHSF
jgi:hypothetical protein